MAHADDLQARHVFLTWRKRDICFTHAEHNILHLHVSHPASDRLSSIVKKVKPNKSGGGLYRTIKVISRELESCAKFSKRSLRYRASVTTDMIVFLTNLRSRLYGGRKGHCCMSYAPMSIFKIIYPYEARGRRISGWI